MLTSSTEVIVPCCSSFQLVIFFTRALSLTFMLSPLWHSQVRSYVFFRGKISLIPHEIEHILFWVWVWDLRNQDRKSPL